MNAGERSSIGLLAILKRGLLRLHSSGGTGVTGTGSMKLLLLEKLPNRHASSELDLGPKLVNVLYS